MTTAPGTLLDRLIRWARRHVVLVDLGWALLWTVMGFLWQPVLTLTPTQNAAWALTVLVIGAGLVVRRVRPRTFIAMAAAALVVHVLAVPIFTLTAAIGACAAAYTAHALLPHRQRLVVTALLAAGTAWAALAYSQEAVGLEWWQRWPVIIVQWVVVALFCLLGALARKRREELDHAVERARLIEQQQAQEVRLATLDERTHIAREMHDIVAHSLGVIIAQADGGRYAGSADPAAATRSLETISTVGRESLVEMRRLLTVLRSDDTRDFVPAPSLADLDRLIEDYRQAGLEVHFVRTGDVHKLADTTALTIYRIVQESLANVLKHAGRTQADVTLEFGPDRVTVDIANPIREPHTMGNPSGHGLVGMRERVGLHGGTLRAGDEGGVWRVYAEVPL